ncbi:hypothetical protein [Burkholderia glumae]|nr:hypothetical protein [Burkholderia glumae]
MKKRPALAGHFSSCGAKRGGRRHEAAAPRGHQVAFFLLPIARVM